MIVVWVVVGLLGIACLVVGARLEAREQRPDHDRSMPDSRG